MGIRHVLRLLEDSYLFPSKKVVSSPDLVSISMTLKCKYCHIWFERRIHNAHIVLRCCRSLMPFTQTRGQQV